MKHRIWLRHLIPLACLLGAGICYVFSFQTGAGALFAAGGIFEFAFWVGLGRTRKQAS
jgi:hypothetical protein